MAIWYVKPASIGGSDSNDGSSFALAKATLDAAYALASSGDTVRVCSDASNPFIDIELLLNSGASNVTFVGADTTDGTPYTGSNRAVLTHTGTGYLIACGDSSVHSCYFYNLSLQGTSNTDGFFSNAISIGHCFINCEFKNLQYGAYISKNTANTKTGLSSFFDCVFDACVRGIFSYDTNNGYYGGMSIYCVNCLFKNNSYGIYSYASYTGTGFADHFTASIDECRFVNNLSGFYAEDAMNSYFNRCVFYSNSSHAISLNGAYQKISVRNTIFHSNGGYAISSATAISIGNICGFIDYNCYYNNTSGIVNANVNGGTTPGSNNVTSNPLFVSLEPGNEDFRLQGTSPCLSVGIGYTQGQ